MRELPNPIHTINIDVPTVAKQGLYITGLSLIVLIPIHLFLNQPFKVTFSLSSFFLFLIGYIVLIVLHEFFHLLGFRVFANIPWRKMKVGMDLKQGIAYATTDQLMANKSIQKAILLPFWTTGILPAMIALYLGSGVLLVLSAFLIGGAAGDFSMYRQLKQYPGDWVVQDDPKLPRLYLYNPDQLTN